MPIASRLGFATIAACAAASGGDAQPRRSVQVHEASIRELQTAMVEGRTTSAALVDAYLARIAAYDVTGPGLNAMIAMNPRARAEAKALDRERRAGRVRGPLHGIPIVIKDNFDTADLPTTGGSLALAGSKPVQDAAIVRRLREAGVVVLGKTNLHELAFGYTTRSSLGGQTRNPYDPARCPGGSSGGTAAAVAASFAAVGWGTDTCGSIRVPAAYNALYGLRPTQGLASIDGIMPMTLGQDTPGPLARTVTDLAIALDATIGDGRFTESIDAGALRGARIGVLTYSFRDSDREISSAIRAAVRGIQAAGATVVEVPGLELDSLLPGTSLVGAEMKFALNDYLARVSNVPARSLTAILDGGLADRVVASQLRGVDAVQERDGPAKQQVLARRAALRTYLLALFDSLRLDALAYPTMRHRPAVHGEPQLGVNCALAAHSGLPALSMPAGFTADGLPIGIELMSRPNADARLVSLAYAWEQSGTRRRPPPTTPALVRGATPRPIAFKAMASAAAASAHVDFSFDPMRSELAWRVRVSGTAPARVNAVVLQHRDSTGATQVVERLSGPGRLRASGTAPLRGTAREALRDGRLSVALVVSGASGPSNPAALVLPR